MTNEQIVDVLSRYNTTLIRLQGDVAELQNEKRGRDTAWTHEILAEIHKYHEMSFWRRLLFLFGRNP